MTGIKCILSPYLWAYFLVFKSIFPSFLGHELPGPSYDAIPMLKITVSL